MEAADLDYENLTGILAPYIKKGRPEARAFLGWFLENIYRLDDTAADDALCDNPNDKGVDAIYVDDINEEIHILQSKTRQNPAATLGDTALKELAGTLDQFTTPEKIQSLLDGGANDELKKIITQKNLINLVSNKYSIKGIFITNSGADANALEYISSHDDIILYDKNIISQKFIDIDAEGGIDQTFDLSCFEVEPLMFQTGEAAKVFLFPALASELVELQGISDGTLFTQNVRLNLGNTKVNQGIKSSIEDQSEHIRFPLYHNGITILCKNAKYENDKIQITDYVVVNGAQSLTVLFNNKQKITSDLKILSKIIQFSEDIELSRKISINNNNQNAIKARDLKSNNQIQLRIKNEIAQACGGKYVLEVKRGEDPGDKEAISNEEAGTLLLAYDLQEPWSCHQRYKVFDELYASIFGRKEVNAHRIILLHEVMILISEEIDRIHNKQFGHYSLTRFFLLYVLSRLFNDDDFGRTFSRNPALLFEEEGDFDVFLLVIRNLLKGLIVDLNYEVRDAGETFDYKSDLKSPVRVKDLADQLLKSYEKDVARDKIGSLKEQWDNLKGVDDQA